MTVPFDMIVRPGSAVLDDEAVTAWLRRLRGRPYVPVSGYDVGAVVRAALGGRAYYFAGVNVENADPALAVHGEGAALSAMLAALGAGARVEEAWVMGAPRALAYGTDDPRALHGGSCCGRCRQHLWEFAAAPDVKIHTVALNGPVETATVAALLPGGFGFASYDAQAAARRAAALQTPPPDEAALRDRLARADAPDGAGVFQWLRSLQPVDYASGLAQAVVIALDNGAAVAGVRMEDAAFTGLTAAQAAVANAVTAFGAVRVTHAYGLTHGPSLPQGALAPLPLSALQVLREFGASRLPLTLFTAEGQAWHSNITAAADIAPTAAKPFRMLRDGQLGS